jgi:hypothetical protein
MKVCLVANLDATLRDIYCPKNFVIKILYDLKKTVLFQLLKVHQVKEDKNL